MLWSAEITGGEAATMKWQARNSDDELTRKEVSTKEYAHEENISEYSHANSSAEKQCPLENEVRCL